MPASRWAPAAFRVYQDLRTTGQPSDPEMLRDYGMPPCRTPSQSNYFAGAFDETSPAEVSHIRSTFPGAYFQPSERTSMFVQDIETYSMGYTNDLADRQFGAAQLAAVNRELRRLAPGVPIGQYAVCPDRQFFTPVNYASNPANEGYAASYASWAAHNADVVAAVAASVDFVAPSLYVFHKTDSGDTDGSGWKSQAEQTAYLTHNVAQAKLYGRPVIPFIWPEIHPSNATFGGDRLTGWQWRFWLDTIYGLDVDGVVIWGLNGDDWSTESAADWWTETLDFISMNGLTP